MHGWEGRGAQLSMLVPPLVARGFQVITYDAPAHGDSPGQRITPADFQRAFAAVNDWVGGVDAVVAHSMGAIVTSMALQHDLGRVQRVAFIAPDLSFAGATQALARWLDLPPSVIGRVEARVARDLGRDWTWLAEGRSMRHHDLPLLVHHDVDDKDVSVKTARAICDRWQPSELVVTEGLGHRRILRDAEVVTRVADFLTPIRANARREDPWRSWLRLDPEAIND